MVMEYLRTFKTGFRSPDSFLSGFTNLVQEREILRYLEKYPGGTITGFFQHVTGLRNAKKSIKDSYRNMFDKWCGRNRHDIATALDLNWSAINDQKGQNPLLHADHFKKRDLAAFSNIATPDPSFGSLHDYFMLAGNSLKMICATIDSIAREVVNDVPAGLDELVEEALSKAVNNGNSISKGSLYKYPEKAMAHYLGRHGNIELTAFEQVAAMMEVYRDTCEKVNCVRELLFSTEHDFYNADLSLLYTYSVPRRFLNYIARKWSVDSKWVRNLLVGWRRKIDPELPTKCQVEPLVGLFSSLADHAKKLADNEDQLKVIGILERKRVLHLLPRDFAVDLSPLLDEKLNDACNSLCKRLPSWPGELQLQIDERATSFSIQALIDSAGILEQSVRNTLSQCQPDSFKAKNCRWFIKNIKIITSKLKSKNVSLFQHYLPGNKYTSSMARLLSSLEVVKENRSTRLFTALRGIVTLAFASFNAKATARLKSALVPDVCVTRPYMSRNRKKTQLPVHLLFNKYIVERKARPGDDKYLNNEDATKILMQGNPIWLGISIYSPDQFDQATRKISGNRKGIFWFQLVPTPPIINRLRKGARLKSIRLNVPSGPTRKIVADMTLISDDPEAFARSNGFIKEMNDEFGTKFFPRDDFIGVDFNKLGKHGIAVGTVNQRINLHEGKNIMASIEKAAGKIDAIRGEIGRLQGAIASNTVDGGRRGRQEAQLSLLHKRLANVRKDAERKVLMIYLYAIHRTGARHASWDAVTVSTLGKHGTLANAITYMPKRKDLKDEFESWSRDLVDAGLLPSFKGVTPVSPFTSQVCDDCFSRTGKQARTRKKGIPYHDFECTNPSCGNKGNRHEVSARVSAIMLKSKIEASTTAGT